MSERWADISGWPDYEVSDHGRVRSKASPRSRFLKPQRFRKLSTNPKGYKTVVLSEGSRPTRRFKTFTVHRLVAMAFVDGDKSLVVGHLDGDPANNHYLNLKWITAQENSDHMVAHGTRQFGMRHPQGKLCARCVRASIELFDVGWCTGDIGALFGVNPATISGYLSGAERKRLSQEEHSA